jgi:hypothetical protein
MWRLVRAATAAIGLPTSKPVVVDAIGRPGSALAVADGDGARCAEPLEWPSAWPIWNPFLTAKDLYPAFGLVLGSYAGDKRGERLLLPELVAIVAEYCRDQRNLKQLVRDQRVFLDGVEHSVMWVGLEAVPTLRISDGFGGLLNEGAGQIQSAHPRWWSAHSLTLRRLGLADHTGRELDRNGANHNHSNHNEANTIVATAVPHNGKEVSKTGIQFGFKDGKHRRLAPFEVSSSMRPFPKCWYIPGRFPPIRTGKRDDSRWTPLLFCYAAPLLMVDVDISCNERSHDAPYDALSTLPSPCFFFCEPVIAVDVANSRDEWHEAQLTAIHWFPDGGPYVLAQFGHAGCLDEWIPIESYRIAPRGTHTANKYRPAPNLFSS